MLAHSLPGDKGQALPVLDLLGSEGGQSQIADAHGALPEAWSPDGRYKRAQTQMRPVSEPLLSSLSAWPAPQCGPQNS